jgi:two-component system OmpR family response regulator/two-component system copper resistance phosphate regulon response regulator CusR
VDDRVAGLNAGADDYLVKPFAFPELTARLNAVCRRTSHRPSSSIVVGPIQLDLTNRRVTRDGTDIELTPTEFSLLEFLMRHAGQVVTRKMLCEHLWEADWEGVTNVIEVHINRLRGKIDRSFSDALIQTVRGRGYVLRIS